MMSLVAYGSSGESGSESENENESEVIIPTKVVKPVAPSQPKKPNVTVVPPAVPSTSGLSNSSKSDVEPKSLGKLGLHAKLPAPKTNTTDRVEEDDSTSMQKDLAAILPAPKHHIPSSLTASILPRKNLKGPVKISIPSLDDFPEEEEQQKPRIKIQPSAKGSGLFALLPPPTQMTVKQANRSLVPNSLTRKLNPTPPVKKPPPKPVISKPPPKPKHDSDPESDGEDGNADFFSLNKEDKLPDVPAMEVGIALEPQTSNIADQSAFVEGSAAVYQGPSGSYEQYDQYYQQAQYGQYGTEASASAVSTEPQDAGQDFVPLSAENLELDDEAIQRLCGRQGKRKREEMHIVDVSQDSILPDQREWLTKQLTEEQPRPSSKSKFSNTQQRRKHQITYLAHVAKENELELKNQWANNRQSRKQTQSKYGF